MKTEQPNAIVSRKIEVTPELIILRIVHQGWELPDFTPQQYAVLVLMARPILPSALAFTAGAMILVVVEELVPESQTSGHSHSAT